MTREQAEALLSKLTRWDLTGDYEGDHSMVPCELDGEFVRFDDVREMLDGMMTREAELLARIQELEANAAKAAELLSKAVGMMAQRDAG